MPIVKYTYDASLHRAGTVGRQGGCSWHGQEACAEQPMSSYETPNGDGGVPSCRAPDRRLVRVPDTS
jgi:hypothetical protein